MPSDIPETIDLLVAGGGTAGATLAGIAARDSGLNVLLLEAGPDYGPFDSGRWPAELLDAIRIPGTHDWGYAGLNHPVHGERSTYDRARVIGGCSSHNGCVALLGHRDDYDGWARLGNPGWDWESVRPAFERAKEALRVRIPANEEVTPYQAAFMAGAVEAGVPRATDLNDPDATAGVAPSPANIDQGIRWNAALAYLDPVRDRDNLTVIGNAMVDRVRIDDGRATAVEAVIDGQRRTIAAGKIVLSAGAYGSPAILQRSGVGDPDQLVKLGIQPSHWLPGVGRNLTDHPIARMVLQGTDELDRRMSAFQAECWCPEEQTLLKARSGHCREAFDLHVFAVSNLDPATGERAYTLEISNVAPRSTGRVMITSTDPEAAPEISHGFLADPDGVDREALVDGIELAREIADSMRDAGLIGREIQPGADLENRRQLADFADASVRIYYHPAASCRMGPEMDTTAVVDSTGKVHGLDGMYICDASIFPRIMRANTNLPAAMLAEHLAPSIRG